MANKPIDTLIKYLQKNNITDFLDEDQEKKIVNDVIVGYKIDSKSREKWLSINKKAMKIIKYCEEDTDEGSDDPVYKGAKVVYPLLSPAVVQLSARLIQHIVRNGRVCEFAVLGKDRPLIDPQTQQPIPGVYVKKDRAKRLTDFASWDFLIKSKTWLKDTHKLCSILASWGTAFRYVYYDPVSKKNCFDLINPEDVVINHNISCLDKAKRITIDHYLTVNDIIEYSRSGYFKTFTEEELDVLNNQAEDSSYGDATEIRPSNKVHCQVAYFDLDGDGYAEPYKVYVHCGLQWLLGIYPAFDFDGIDVNEKGEILKITPKIEIVDYHLIDDPEGKFYSLGLNYFLINPDKSITSLLRQEIDAGTLSNAASCTGFITSVFKTQEKDLEFELGEYKVLDVNPTIQNPQNHVIPLPAREPSQVLLALLQVLIQSGEKIGMITDVLTGDTAGQNVPATTMLAMVEQGTRVFKPIIEKLYISLKNEFILWFELNAKYINEEQYIKFFDSEIQVTREDFNQDDLDVCPVADPTMSSEAHKFAKMQAIVQLFSTQVVGALNVQENLLELYRGFEFENPERFIAPPQPPAPDPKMEMVKIKAADLQMKHQVEQLRVALESKRIENEQLKIVLKKHEIDIKKDESFEKQMKMKSDAMQGMAQAAISKQQANTAAFDAITKRKQVEVMSRKKPE